MSRKFKNPRARFTPIEDLAMKHALHGKPNTCHFRKLVREFGRPAAREAVSEAKNVLRMCGADQ